MTELDLKSLWKEQPVNPTSITIDELTHRARKTERTILWRNIREWVAAAIIVPVFGHMALTEEAMLARVGAWWCVAAAVFITVKLWRDGRMKKTADAALDTRAFIASHAEELRAQAALLRGVPRWYIAPIGIGILILHLSKIPARGESWTFWVAYLVGAALLMVGIGFLNVRAAKKLEAKAEETLSELDPS